MVQRQITNLEKRLSQVARNLVQVSQATRTTVNGVDEGGAGWPTSEPATDRNPRRFQHFGFRSRPPVGTPWVQLLVGQGGAAEVVVAEDDPNAGPQDLASGEVALFSIGNSKAILVDKDGNVVVAVPVGKLVQVGGSTDFMLLGTTYRNAQATLDTALITFLAALKALVGVVAGPTPAQLATYNAASDVMVAAVNAFEAAAKTYLSAIAKLG